MRLISEKPFAVGDWIKVGETDGYVLSIDLRIVGGGARGSRGAMTPRDPV
jgi:small-conductance mechanosensitive channel